MGGDDDTNKKFKVKIFLSVKSQCSFIQIRQNHKVDIVHIDTATMDHYCNVTIFPDRLNPNGIVKRGIKIGLNEFHKGSRFRLFL